MGEEAHWEGRRPAGLSLIASARKCRSRAPPRRHSRTDAIRLIPLVNDEPAEHRDRAPVTPGDVISVLVPLAGG